MRRLLALAVSVTGFAACATGMETIEVQPMLAGYRPMTDITAISKLDRDIADFNAAMDSQPGDAIDYSNATNIYNNGKNSWIDGEGSTLRSLKSLVSAENVNNMNSISKLFKLYSAYYKSPTYADTFIMNALTAKAEFADFSIRETSRRECARRGTQMHLVSMYAFYKLSEAVQACNRTHGDGVASWDQAWALYSGSLEGPTGEGQGTLLFNMAEQMCQSFRTCIDGKAKVNIEMQALFEAGRTLLSNGHCAAADRYVSLIVQKANTAVVQATILYSYRGDIKGSYKAGNVERDKAIAASWGLASYLLPQVNFCNRLTAQALKDNTIVSATNHFKDGYAGVAKMLQTVYTCLGITCEDIGVLTADDGRTVILPVCNQLEINLYSFGNESNLAVSFLIVLLFIILIILFYCCYTQGYKRGNFKKNDQDAGIGENGNAAAQDPAAAASATQQQQVDISYHHGTAGAQSSEQQQHRSQIETI